MPHTLSEPHESPSRLLILGYHKIGPPPEDGWESWYYVSEVAFEQTLAALRKADWTPIDAAALVRGLEGEPLPPRSVLVTFDDGYRSALRHALPVLRHTGFPAVMFVPTDFVGGTNEFDRDVEPEEPICGWEELRELERSGVSVQSHGATHRGFAELSQQDRHEELRRSKAQLEERLGKRVDLFSFPYGDDGDDPTAAARSLAAAGYRAACLYGGGVNVLPVPSPYRLERVAMGPDSNLHEFFGVER